MKVKDLMSENLRTNVESKEIINNKNSAQFKEQLVKANNDVTKEKLEKLLSDIDNQSKLLGERLNLENLVKYKRLVKGFLDEAVSSVFQFEKNFSWDNSGRKKTYSLVKNVNERLVELTEEVLNKDSNGTKALKLLGEIRGLLIDFYR